MVDAGPVLTDPPGLNLKNLDDEEQLSARARALRRGRRRRARRRRHPDGRGHGHGAPGTHLVDPAARDAGRRLHVDCVGGMGAHWTCATPGLRLGADPVHPGRRARRRARRGRAPARDDDAGLRRVAAGRRDPRTARRGVRRRAAGRTQGRDPPGRRRRATATAASLWTGVDTILGHAARAGKVRAACRDALPRARRRRWPRHGRGRRAPAYGRRDTVDARVVVVAADSLRTPQLLQASGIRPPALGRHLTEHPLTFAVVRSTRRRAAARRGARAAGSTPSCRS